MRNGFNRYESNFRKLKKVIPGILEMGPGDAAKSVVDPSGGLMDLSVDVLHAETDDIETRITIALAHYYEQNGDLIPDPDMELMIHVFNPPMFDKDHPPALEALTYQDSFGYQRVYPEPGMVNPRLKKELNQFLSVWLNNLNKQGHLIGA